MQAIIKIKQGKFRFDTEDCTPFFSVSHPVFQAIEKFGFEVIESQDKETQEMYFGSFEELHGDSYLSLKGAVQDAILNMCIWIEENNKSFITSKMFYDMELDVAFES